MVRLSFPVVTRSLRRFYNHSAQRYLIGVLLCLVPLYLLRTQLFYPGVPYPGDFISNLYPPLIVRWHLSHGQLPIHTPLWYGGEFITSNPLFKGFYPGAWPMYIPGIPLILVAKLLIGLHYVAAVGIAYWYGSERFQWWLAAPFALLFLTPMATFGGWLEKVFGWPWIVLFVWQLTDDRMRRDPVRAGIVAGGALGMAFLAGDNYHVFYGACLLVILVLATRAWTFGAACGIGGLVGLPKLVFSIIPVVLLETDRPLAGPTLKPEEFFAGLAGFGPGTVSQPLEFGALTAEGAAIVGVFALVLAVGVLVAAYMIPEQLPVSSRWLIGVSLAGGLSLLLVTKWSYLYTIPGLSTFRVGSRAVGLAAICVLLLCWAGIRSSVDHSQWLQIAVAGLVVLSVVNALGVWGFVSTGSAVQTSIGDRVADDIGGAGCSDVWIEGGYSKTKTPSARLIGYTLLERGVALQAVEYGKIGQEYSVTKGGQYTFGALIVGEKLTKPLTELSGGWWTPVLGTVRSSDLTLYRTYQTEEGPVYVYLTPNCKETG